MLKVGEGRLGFGKGSKALRDRGWGQVLRGRWAESSAVLSGGKEEEEWWGLVRRIAPGPRLSAHLGDALL